MEKGNNMQHKTQLCYHCGKALDYTHEDDCWSTAFHVPFDTLLKIKTLMKGQCLCSDCLKKLAKDHK